MPRLFALLMTLLCATALAQTSPYASRGEALKGLSAQDEFRRAAAVSWIAGHGTHSDAGALAARLSDASALVRATAERGLWLLWGRSGDKEIDALMAKGEAQMQAARLKQAIATFSEVIRRKPAFAEGWNRRATALYLAGEYRRSIADCDEVMKRNPLHFGALAGYGQIYFRLERYDEAIEYWKRALEVNPNMVGVEFNIQGAEQLLVEKRRHST